MNGEQMKSSSRKPIGYLPRQAICDLRIKYNYDLLELDSMWKRITGKVDNAY